MRGKTEFLHAVDNVLDLVQGRIGTYDKDHFLLWGWKEAVGELDEGMVAYTTIVTGKAKDLEGDGEKNQC